jgi:hypothetical protein
VSNSDDGLRSRFLTNKWCLQSNSFAVGLAVGFVVGLVRALSATEGFEGHKDGAI